jgi:DNA polymerase
MDELELAAVTRAVVQRLTDFQRAGLSHWKRIVPVATDPTAGKPATTTASAAMGKSAVTSVGGQFNTPTPVSTATLDQQVSTMAASKRSVSAVASSASAPVVKSPFEPLNLPRDERVTRLNVLSGQVKACVRCEELAACRTQTVFGVGNPEAKILFVGEAPGADEDKQGEPFVGRAGQLLNDIIKACRINREDIYICNVLRCRPPGNRLPSPEEAGNCREYLDGQIAIVNPDYIVCWGSTAAKNLLASDLPIGKMRGKFHEYGRAKVLCTYHPSYLLRNPAAKKDVWEDMKLLFLDMGIDLTRK